MIGSWLFDSMTWSYSRLSAYDQCPYQFYLKYVLCEDEQKTFFSTYGSFFHEILAACYSGSMSFRNAGVYYLTNFQSNVKKCGISDDIYLDYFESGLDYLRAQKPFGVKPLGVEMRFDFSVYKYSFTGFADLVCRDESGSLCLIDHKSRKLKQRSSRARPTKSDAVLDRYLRQLYLYSKPIYERFGEYPKRLIFNCYRSGDIIAEPFDPIMYINAIEWASDTIGLIKSDQSFKPCVDYYYCKNICGFSQTCEYANMIS